MRKQQGKIGTVGSWIVWRALLAVSAVISRLPFHWLGGLGAVGGSLAYYCLPARRRIAHANLRRAFGAAWDERAVCRVARRSCGHMATNLLEFVCLRHLCSADRFARVRVAGRAHLDQALDQGNGAILVSAHYGSWELLLAWLAAEGYPTNLVVRELDHAALRRIHADTRAALGQRTLYRKRAANAALGCLRRNEPLLMLVDQHAGHGSVEVEFFGRPAAAAAGAAVLALRTAAPLVPVFCTRRPGGRYDLEFHPAILPEAAERQEDEIARLTRAATGVVEAQVRACPEQWLWLHDRWKRPGESHSAQAETPLPRHGEQVQNGG